MRSGQKQILFLEDSGIDWKAFATTQTVKLLDKKKPRQHQTEALAAVKEGLAEADRGKIIMACGTGKTYTALHIAEQIVGIGGRVLYLVPSLSLMSQTIREWSIDANVPLRCFAVTLFLASSVLICEGASEVGFIRGFSRFISDKGKLGVEARGVALVDGGGGGPDSLINRADVFHRLGYRVAVFMDSDLRPDATKEDAFIKAGNTVVRWQDGLTLEDTLFLGQPDEAVDALLNFAIELHGAEAIDANIRSRSLGKVTLAQVQIEGKGGTYAGATRTLLGQSARVDGKKARKGGWFKSVGYMEDVTFNIVMKHLEKSDKTFKESCLALFKWFSSGS